MKKHWEMSAEDFNRFLTWLGGDQEDAGQKYEDLRQSLILVFTCRRCHIPEELADETINRVIRRLPQMIETYQGDPSAYLHTVAHHLFLEYTAAQARLTALPPEYDLPSPPAVPETEQEREEECLEQCLSKLDLDNRRLVLEYYQEEKQAKIDHRKQVAARMGIAVSALRLRAYRVRQQLQICLDECLDA